MIEAQKMYDDVVTLKALPDLVMHENLANVDKLIHQLQCCKPAITEAQSLEMLID